MSVWMCRAGKFGEREDYALDNGRAVIGWEEMPDLCKITSREGMLSLLREFHPQAKQRTLENWRNQLWAFRSTMQINDVIVLPQKLRPAIAFGIVKGDYEYDSSALVRHSREVDWVLKDLPRVRLPKDLLQSLGASQTVCRIARNNAEQRIAAFMKTGGATPEPIINSATELDQDKSTSIDDPTDFDIQGYADDKLRDFIKENFDGHDFARLVEGILNAKGYKTINSKPGRDGGVDILAGRGELGFENPRICVQVKSEASSLDVGVLRELQATVTNFGAEYGLLVGWGGFKQSLVAEGKRLFFKIRLWDSADLLDNLFEVYPKLSPELQSKIPLKQIWTLVDTEVEDED
jgi:restriction system protein